VLFSLRCCRRVELPLSNSNLTLDLNTCEDARAEREVHHSHSRIINLSSFHSVSEENIFWINTLYNIIFLASFLCKDSFYYPEIRNVFKLFFLIITKCI
jgi:hypothetical protein